MDLTYQEHLPSAPLNRYVRCIWSLRGTSSAAPQTIVPDGCPEILINCADPFVQFLANARGAPQPRLTLIGEVRRPVTVSEGIMVDMLGIRLVPGVLGVLFDEPAEQLVDGTLDVEAVLPASDRNGLQAVLSVEDVHRRIQAVERWLLERLRKSQVDDRLIRRAVHIVEARHGMAPIERLAAELSVQRRTLERAFKSLMGLSPKAFARVRRFRHALKLVEGGQPFADVSACCGYFDQAHLSNDFRVYAGRSPAAYLRSSHELDQLFAGDLVAPLAEVTAAPA